MAENEKRAKELHSQYPQHTVEFFLNLIKKGAVE